jgi:hypothetical protein
VPKITEENKNDLNLSATIIAGGVSPTSFAMEYRYQFLRDLRARYLQTFECGMIVSDMWLVLDESCSVGLDHTLYDLSDSAAICDYLINGRCFNALMSTPCTRNLGEKHVAMSYGVMVNFIHVRYACIRHFQE